MASWGYVAAGFALSFAGVLAYALQLERRIARLRARLRSGGRR
ncbi:MAG: hypothetical protein ACRDMA_11110 [Solirubrobacterales bacterium]